MNSIDRKVIVVASKAGLIKMISKVYAKSTIDNLLPIPFFKTDAILKHFLEIYYKNKSLDEVVSDFYRIIDLDTEIKLFSPRDAVNQFKFNVGLTPPDGSIYIQHPIQHERYIVPEEFSIVLSREKEAAFRLLASSLGAKKLSLIHAEVRTKRGIIGGTISISEAASEIGIKASFDNSNRMTRSVYSEFGLPRHPPHVPEDLKPWVDMDPDLRTMAHDRVNGSLLKNFIKLEFKEDLGIGGSIASKISSYDINSSLKYKSLSHSIWSFEVEYYPINS
ncbi:hypothetical protein [Aeromonas sp. 600774]|uniref:hypothetical protein n=1 Tax=Aeromonas sp. 600774 TaxID=2712032 RepID=UPI003B9E98FB